MRWPSSQLSSHLGLKASPLSWDVVGYGSPELCFWCHFLVTRSCAMSGGGVEEGGFTCLQLSSFHWVQPQWVRMTCAGELLLAFYDLPSKYFTIQQSLEVGKWWVSVSVTFFIQLWFVNCCHRLHCFPVHDPGLSLNVWSGLPSRGCIPTFYCYCIHWGQNWTASMALNFVFPLNPITLICPPSDVSMCGSLKYVCALSRKSFVEL